VNVHIHISEQHDARACCAVTLQLAHITDQLNTIMATQTEALNQIKASLAKVGAELTTKIEELIAAQGNLTPDAQTIADEINARLAALDAIVPDDPAPLTP
jgi:hypothetical protein